MSVVIQPTNRLVRRWHIQFENGYAIECYRRHRPVRLASAFSQKKAANGSVYGDYTIIEGGLFNKQVINVCGAEWEVQL
jgi:hypothetical protein